MELKHSSAASLAFPDVFSVPPGWHQRRVQTFEAGPPGEQTMIFWSIWMIKSVGMYGHERSLVQPPAVWTATLACVCMTVCIASLGRSVSGHDFLASYAAIRIGKWRWPYLYPYFVITTLLRVRCNDHTDL